MKHLRVSCREAEAARHALERSGVLHSAYLPQREGDSVLWPLCGAADGDVVEREPRLCQRPPGDYRQQLPSTLRKLAPRGCDLLGHAAILRLSDEAEPHATLIAEALLASHGQLRTVALDSGVDGRWRVRALRVIAGEDDLVVHHRENGLRFEVDLRQVFFSPRLATERARIAALVRPGERFLDPFAGAAPFAVSAAAAGAQVLAADGNPAAQRWAERNSALNNLSSENFEFHIALAETLLPSLRDFDRVVLNHPTAQLNYLEPALAATRPGGSLHLYLLANRGEDATAETAAALVERGRVEAQRLVHPFSPGRDLRVLDIRRESS